MSVEASLGGFPFGWLRFLRVGEGGRAFRHGGDTLFGECPELSVGIWGERGSGLVYEMCGTRPEWLSAGGW